MSAVSLDSSLPSRVSFVPLAPGEIRPLGWILRYMTMDLEHGTTGSLDRVVPGIFEDELYGRDRRTVLKDGGETGSTLDWEKENPAGKVEMKWWNAETQGNWWDGFFRTCCYVETAGPHREKARRIVKDLLATQDEDGYLGIYGRDLRFQHGGENGELWAQAVLLRALLGWGEMTGDREAIDAALRALDHTIDALASQDTNPFDVQKGCGGVAHGLMLTDVCEVANRITGEERYLAFAAGLYLQYSEMPGYTNDLRQEILMSREIPFQGHGAHTYEHLRSLLLASRVTGREDLKLAWKQALRKLQSCLLPSGAGIGFEFILGVSADTERTGTEFCTMVELRNSLLSALENLGDASLGDLAEQLTFNGILGARAKDCCHLAYCITDSCFCLDAHEPREGKEENRFKFSPAHQDVAVCCAPNAARQFPCYLASMWASDAAGFRALVYGPCEIHREFSGVEVRITEETDYPFSDEILLRVNCEKPVRFRLSLRVPAWRGGMRLDGGDAEISEESGWTHLTKEWQTDVVRITFPFQIEERVNSDGRRSIHRGPLLYVHPIASRTVAFPKYPEGGHDLHFLPDAPASIRHSLPLRGANWTLERSAESPHTFWGVPSLALRGTLRQDVDGMDRDTSLVPMAFTVLRQASFD